MPIAPRPPCATPGCPNRASKYGRCTVHAAELQRDWRERYPDTRPSRAERDYGPEWTRIRLRYLHDTPWCADCAAEGKRLVATEVHHVISRKQGGSDESGNLMSLCHDHHARRTARQEPGGWGRPGASK